MFFESKFWFFMYYLIIIIRLIRRLLDGCQFAIWQNKQSSFISYNSIFTIAYYLIINYFFCIHETERQFDSQKMYILSKKFLVSITITHEESVMLYILMKISKIFLISNVLSLDQSFLVCIKM